MKRRLSPNMRFLLIVAACFLLLRLPSLFEPYWYGDEGIYLTIGRSLRHGATLYKDIHDNKPPLLYYLAAVGQSVFGFRLLLLVWMIPTYFVFFRLATKFLAPTPTRLSLLFFIILTSIPLLEGNIANAEIFMLLPTLLGIYQFFVRRSYLSSGLLLGLALTIKIPVAVEFAFLYFFFFVTNLIPLKSIRHIKAVSSRLFQFALGFIFPATLWSIFFYNQGVLIEYLRAAFVQNIGYLSSWSGSHSGSLASGGLVVRFIGLLLIYLFLGFLRFRKKLSINAFFLLAWLCAATFGALLSARPYPHYLIQVLPALSLLIFYFPSSKDISRLLAPFSLVVLIGLFFKYQFYVYPVFSYYSNFYFHANSREFFNRDINAIYDVSRYITTHTRPSDKIFVWGDEPYTYALSGRSPASRFTVAYHVADFRQYQSVITELTSSLPPYIIYFPQPNRPFLELDRLVGLYYSPVEVFGRGIVFQRRQ